MALTFDTGKHARAIREGGVPAAAADATVDAIVDATDSFVTQDVLRAELAIVTERLRAELWRAMYLQIGAVAAIAGLALALAKWVL